MVPTPPQIAGKHFVVYEAYYKQIDPKDVGRIEAMQAANFLKKSGLSVVVLSRIWDLSDPNGQGFLDKRGFYVAMKLVALAQMGTDLSINNILQETPNPPKLGDLPKVTASSVQMVPPNAPVDWTIKLADRQQYEELFESLKPENNVLVGNKVKGVLMDSKLPVDVLGRIWELADQDKDGNLDRPEFVVCMHLVYQALAKKAIPAVLPPELKKELNGNLNNSSSSDGGFVANFPTDIAPPPVPPLPAVAASTLGRGPPTVPPLPAALLHGPPVPAQPVVPLSSKDWVVSTIEKLKYDEIFERSDIDRDGLVSGMEIRDVFLQSGIPQNCLAHIWSLCDTDSTGKLNGEQFALAMWMVDRKKKGIDPPAALEPIMVPPRMRKAAASGGMAAVEEPMLQEAQPVYTNPELEMVAKEIEEILKERRQLENEVYHKEVDIRVKSGEVRSLQSELDTLAATLKQLENQKGEAQKRLDDLKLQVTKIRDQCTMQEETIKEQSTELEAKKSELQALKDEETALETEHKKSTEEMEMMTKNLQDTQLQISQIKAMFTQLQENQRQLNDAVNSCKVALETEDIGAVSDYSLKLCPEFKEVKAQLEELNKPKPDPATEATANSQGGFESDPFAGKDNNNFGAFGDDNFGDQPKATGFDDSFGSAFNGGGQDRVNAASDSDADPFAILHAPTTNKLGASGGPPVRPESPSPALPPKKAKQPPPRPAPPRPMQGPTPTKFEDSGSSFANFDAFDNNKKVADFADDPFKDYRYEDVFNIEDPFAPDDNDRPGDNKSSKSVDDLFKPHRSEDPFSDANLNSRPGAWSSQTSVSQPQPPKGTGASNRLQMNDLNSNRANNNISDFANFANVFEDTKPAALSSSDPFLDNSHTRSSSTRDQGGDLFADFNDNFGSAATTTTTTTINAKKSNQSAFDPFGISTTNNNNGSSSDKFSATFDDDPFGDTLPSAVKTEKVAAKSANGHSTKSNNSHSKSNKSTTKYSEDYSKNFDSDLQEVLKRSLFEQ